MAKRIVTKIGDIFCAELDGQFKRFFQYIAIDKTQLSSSVIRVFKRKYPMDYTPDLNEILKDEVEFYAHTMLRAAIIDNAWYKVGKSLDIGSLDHILFRIEGDLDKVDISEKWWVWHINQEEFFVGKLPKKYMDVDYGIVFYYKHIINKMRDGDFKFSIPGY